MHKHNNKHKNYSISVQFLPSEQVKSGCDRQALLRYTRCHSFVRETYSIELVNNELIMIICHEQKVGEYKIIETFPNKPLYESSY